MTNIRSARQAHSYGLVRIDYQLKMQATFSLRQLVRELLKQHRPTQGIVRPLAA
jgi:hypothetical protein